MLVFFQDNETAEKVMATDDPVLQKFAGGMVRNFNHIKWEQKRNSFMKDTVLTKFSLCPNLKTFFQDTGTKKLLEALSRDTHFGIMTRH